MKTTIQIDKNTLLKLKRLKLSKRESYDEVVDRLIEAARAHKWEFKLKL